MSKNKKKHIKKETPGPEARRQLGKTGGALKEKTDAGIAAATRGARRVSDALSRFFAKKSSLIPLSFFLFCCILVFNLLSGYRYLFSDAKPMILLGAVQVYAIDYHVGFISRVLIGEIVSWFCPTVSLAQIASIAKACVLVSFVLQAVLAAVVTRKACMQKDWFVLPFIAVFVFHPFTCIQNVVLLGILDLYNLILYLIFFFYANRKISLLLTPVFCFIGVLIHYQFTFAFFPGFFAIQLYMASKDGKTDVKKLAGAMVTMAVTLCAALYFVFFAKRNVTMSLEEFRSYLCSRYADYGKTGLSSEYLEYYVFNTFNGKTYDDPVEFLRLLIGFAVERFEARTFSVYVYLMVPVICVLSSVWLCFVKHSRGLRRFTFLLFLIHPLLLVLTVVLSSDKYRWFANYTMTALVMLFAVYASGEPLFGVYKERVNAVLNTKAKKLCAAAAFAVYVVSGLILVSSVIKISR